MKKATLPQVRFGRLEVRLAENEDEIVEAQNLRYRVFYDEMGAKADQVAAAEKSDSDIYDKYCDHLLVIDHEHKETGKSKIVGTYRLLPNEMARKIGQFYTASEFNIDKVIDCHENIVELGRSCIDPAYRTGATIQILWLGLAAYVFEYDISLMFGCASFPGTNIEDIKLPLSYLYHNHLAPEDLRPRALDHKYIDMNFIPQDEINIKDAFSSLPPLLKGYLRIGGCVGDGAVIDEQFNTTDVCILVDTNLALENKYFRHYQRSAKETTPT